MAREKSVEEANLTNAVDASEAETAGDGEFTGQGNENSVQEEYSWWDVLLGKHDQEIFERSTAHADESLKGQASTNERNKSDLKATAVSFIFYAYNDTVLMPFSQRLLERNTLCPVFGSWQIIVALR